MSERSEAWAVFAAEPAAGGPAMIEYTSRGDRVPASLWRASGGPERLVVLLTSEEGSEAADSAPGLAKDGAFVFAPDLPLCGRRASPKLSAQLRAPGPGDLQPAERERLVAAALDQGVADVRRGLEVLGQLHPETQGVAAELIGAGDFATSVAASLADQDPRLSVRAPR